MTKWRKNKTFIKNPRKKLEIKKIRTDNKIPKIKKINIHLSTHATLEERGSDNPSNNTIEVDI
jgi:hypothetical protein